MFTPAKMLHAQLVISKGRSQQLIVALHEAGICELKETDGKDLSEMEAVGSNEIEGMRQRLARLMAALDEFKPVRQPENLVKALFFPKEPEKIKVNLLSNEAVLGEVKAHLDVIEPKAEKQLDELKGIGQRISEIGFEIEELSILPAVNTNVFSPTKNIAVLLGIITNKAVAELGAKLQKSVYLLKERDENTSLIIIACKQAERERIEKELHSIGFEPLSVRFTDKKPREIIRELEQERIELVKRTREIRLYLQNTAKMYWEKLEVLAEELGVCVERAKALQQLKAGNSFTVMEAWLPEKNLGKFKRIVGREAGKYYLATDERADAPTLLKNPKLLKPFEMLTELYSVPKYNGLDPTPVIAITFAIFFGYMLTDFVYGVALALIAFAIFRGIGRYNAELRSFSAVLIALGISTALLGAAFTSYFGDFFPKIGIEMPGLLDPLKQVIVIIGLAVLIGALHISIGLLMGFIDNFRLGKKRDAFAKQGVWLFFMAGAVFALLGEQFLMVGLGLIALAVVLNIIFSVLEGGAVIGMLSIFDFSGFIGDIFSYARLTALAIGTAGIALAVNFMALLVNDMVPVIGLPLAIIVFLGGHFFNMIMNGLGAFIHALRLHFLEFFQKFYDGGGRLYRPFYAKREKTIGGE